MIIQRYTTECSSVVVPPGFGDFLRGCVFLHQDSRNKFDLVVDFSKHPLGKYIVPHHTRILDATARPAEYFNEDHGKLDILLQTMGESDEYVITSHFHNDHLGAEDKEFMKKILTFTDNFNNKCSSIIENLGLNDYYVLHIRMGDQNCNENITAPGSVLKFIEHYVIPEKLNVLIVSDCYSVKKYLGDRYKLKYIDAEPAHLGTCSQNFKYREPQPLADDEILANSLADFVIMSKSRGIFYWSVYNGPSGFSQMCSKIYDINHSSVDFHRIESRYHPTQWPVTINGVLYPILSAGCFSDHSTRLDAIRRYFNHYRKFPLKVNSYKQLNNYKKDPNEIIEHYFFQDDPGINEKDMSPPIFLCSENYEDQFSNYKSLNFCEIKPFIAKYFKLSDPVRDRMNHLKKGYMIDYDNTSVIYYRGHGKCAEVCPPSYNEIINKAKEIQKDNPEMVFILQSDETEFIEECKNHFSKYIHFKEIPTMSKNPKSDLLFNIPPEHKLNCILWFAAAVRTMAKCKYIVCGSGNGEMWMALFRGNANGMNQFLKPLKYADLYEGNFWV
jgi:hypothetical protein